MQTLENLVLRVADSIRPPERITVSEAAEKYRKLYNPGSYIGPWKNSVAPYLNEIMDTLTSLEYTGLVFAGPARCGKALALDTPIATPTGWSDMANLEVGDEIFTSDGSVTKVIAISEVWQDRETYEILFSNSDRIVCDAAHDWVVKDCHQPNLPRKMSTLEIFQTYKLGRKSRSRYCIDLVNKNSKIYIRSVKLVSSVPTKCIQVAHSSGMFLAGKTMIPTHNSDIFFNYLTHTVVCDPNDMMLVHMKQGSARDWSQLDLRRAFRHTKVLGSRIMPGRQNMNVHDIRFTNGMSLLVKWPTITELSGKTIPRLWGMDFDRFPADIDGEGNGFDMMRKRAQTFGRNGMTVVESSPGFEVSKPNFIPETPHQAPPVEGGVLSVYNRGDRRRWIMRCISCKETFESDFKCLSYPDSSDLVEASEMATLDCPTCGYSYTHDSGPGQPGKHGLNLEHSRWLKDGQVWLPDGTVGGKELARSDIASFWLKGTSAAFATWSSLVLKYLQAMKEFEDTQSTASLKTTINLDQGLPFFPPKSVSSVLPEDLKARAQDLGDKVVPIGVRFMMATIDIQDAKFVVQVHGVDKDGNIYIIDRFDIRKSNRLDDDGERIFVKPSTYIDDWKLLIPHVIEKSYPLGDGSGRRMKIKTIGCDSGGRAGVTSMAYDFWRHLRDVNDANHHVRFQLLKGDPKPNNPTTRLNYPDSERTDRHAGARGEIPVLMMNSTLLKDQLNGIMNNVGDSGNKLVFPDWLPNSFYVELTVETRLPKGWINRKNQRNESWDLLYYCLALMHSKHCRYHKINWDSPPSWADVWDSNDFVFSEENKTPFKPQENKDVDLEMLADLLA